MIPASFFSVKERQRRARCEAAIVAELQKLTDAELREDILHECEAYGIPVDEWQVVQFLTDIRAGRYVDFEEIGDAYLDQRVAEAMARDEREARERPPQPPKKPKQLRLSSPSDVARAVEALLKKKITGRSVEIVFGGDGVLTLKVIAAGDDGSSAQTVQTNGRGPSEADLDKELAQWEARHGQG